MLTWEVPSKKNHSTSWYMIAGCITLSLAIWGILTQIYALAIVVIILAGVYVLLENNAPDTTTALVNENGVGIGEWFYDYGQIESFSLNFDESMPKSLHIRLKQNTLRTIDIPLGEVPIDEIRAFLLGYLPEGEPKEISFLDRIIERIGL